MMKMLMVCIILLIVSIVYSQSMPNYIVDTVLEKGIIYVGENSVFRDCLFDECKIYSATDKDAIIFRGCYFKFCKMDTSLFIHYSENSTFVNDSLWISILEYGSEPDVKTIVEK